MFQNDGYFVLKNSIHPQLLKHLSIQFKLLKDSIYYIEKKTKEDFLEDEQTTNSFCWYSPWGFETLMILLQPDIEKISGKKLYPTYSYGRIYYNNSSLERHTDRRCCEISASVCIETTDPWEIYFETLKKETVKVILEPGDLIVYRGRELPHWREPYKGKEQMQAFLHYVDAEGPFADLKYDSRYMLGMHSETKTNREK